MGVKPPKNIPTAVLHGALNFLTTSHIENTDLAIGAEIILGLEGCGEQNLKYILGEKLDNPLIIANNPSKNYQYKPEYSLIYVKPGNYKLCAQRQFSFTEYNQEYIYEEFLANKEQWFDLSATQMLYLGDIHVSKGDNEIKNDKTAVCAFLKEYHPKLLKSISCAL